MIITSSQVALSSQHSWVEQESRQESLKFWREADQTQPSNMINLQTKQDQISISAQAQSLWDVQAQTGPSAAPAGKSYALDLSDADKQKIALIQRMLEMLTGKKIKLRVLDPEAWAKKQVSVMNLQMGQSSAAQNRQVVTGKRYGWGLEYERHEMRFEQEKTSMQAGGVVKTADGRTINFAMDVSMSREFMSRLDVSVRAGDALVDPLVVNLSGSVGDLTEQKYSFDIDSDGTADQISFAGPGSGFLALDRNNDGQINDGGELFGTRSGDGFEDLAAFDSDGNNWIDESDAVFDKLRIWMKDPSGRDQLVALGQAGVGAIYLGNVSTEFAVKDTANVQQGQMRSSGVFLRENGSAGVVSQIDLVI